MTAITKFAQGKECTARIPGVCNRNPETSVWAHINSVRTGSGMGKKSPDVCGLIACGACHDEIDRRTRILEKEYVELLALRGHMESIALLWKDGVIK